MITQQDMDILTAAILRTVPPAEKPTVVAAIHLAQDILWKFERITIAFEKIAAKG